MEDIWLSILASILGLILIMAVLIVLSHTSRQDSTGGSSLLQQVLHGRRQSSIKGHSYHVRFSMQRPYLWTLAASNTDLNRESKDTFRLPFVNQGQTMGIIWLP